MSSVLHTVYSEFKVKKDVTTFIKLFSVLTWEKIGFVRRHKNLRFYEVTATQNLLFQFRLLAISNPTTVRMFEAKNEKANGNDIELFIHTTSGSLFFPCQAKILDPNDVYKSIEHPQVPKRKPPAIPPKQQIESLIAYASGAKRSSKGVPITGIPIYLFYNFSRNRSTLTKLKSSTYKDVEVYGCSYVKAKDLVGSFYDGKKKGWTKTSFADIHPSLGKPFYTLFELLSRSNTKSALKAIGISDAEISDIPIYQQADLNAEQEDYWIPVSEVSIYETPVGAERVASQKSEFNPKHRIDIFPAAGIDPDFIVGLFS